MVSEHCSVTLATRTCAADLKLADKLPAGQVAAHRSGRVQRRVQLGAKSMFAATLLVAAGGFVLAETAFRTIRQILAADRPRVHLHLWAEADQVLAAGLPDAVLFAPWTHGIFPGGTRFRLDETLVGKFAAAWDEPAVESLSAGGEVSAAPETFTPAVAPDPVRLAAVQPVQTPAAPGAGHEVTATLGLEHELAARTRP